MAASVGKKWEDFRGGMSKDLPKGDPAKIVLTVATGAIMLIYCFKGWRKNVKYNKMLEKAAGGKDAAAALKGKLLPPELRKKIGDVAGFGPVKAVLTGCLTVAFLLIMNLLP